MNTKAKRKKKTNGGFCKSYKHYKTGKLMIAADYGYEAWPFGR